MDDHSMCPSRCTVKLQAMQLLQDLSLWWQWQMQLFVKDSHLEAQSSLNEEGDQGAYQIAPLTRPDVKLAPVGSCRDGHHVWQM